MDVKIYNTRYKSFKFNHKIRDKEFKALSHLLEFDLDHYEPLALRSLYIRIVSQWIAFDTERQMLYY